MKKLFMMMALTAITWSAFSQAVDLRRRIEVNGVAEKEVTPDIINVSISLQEYLDGKKKVTIDQLEDQLENAVRAAGIPKEDFTINNVSAWNNTWNKKKTPDFLAAKQYLVKLHDLNKYDQVLSKIDPKGIQNTGIESYDYSKIEDLKRDLKVKALLAAREKAGYLLAAVNDKVGDVISITEVDNGNFQAPRAMVFKSMAAGANQAAESDIDFKTIKLSFQINAVFEVIK